MFPPPIRILHVDPSTSLKTQGTVHTIGYQPNPSERHELERMPEIPPQNEVGRKKQGKLWKKEKKIATSVGRSDVPDVQTIRQ